MNISNCKLNPYSGLLINSISSLWPAIWMHMLLYQWNVEELDTLTLSCDMIHQLVMVPICGNSTISPNGRVPVKGASQASSQGQGKPRTPVRYTRERQREVTIAAHGLQLNLLQWLPFVIGAHWIILVFLFWAQNSACFLNSVQLAA